MSYFDLLFERQYFDTFLNYFNSLYSKQGQDRETHYGNLIKRYYRYDNQNAPSSSLVIDNSHIEALLDDFNHIYDMYESLRVEFGMGKRSAKLVPAVEFFSSIQGHKAVIVGLTNYRMDCIVPGTVPQDLLDALEQLFYGLRVVPPNKPLKLVAVSKTLHFLLPNLVMPVDGASVLRFLRKGPVPQKINKQFDLLIEVFNKYIELAAQLGLKSNNGDGNWWNISVPKRIDNAIGGFWAIFNDANLERIICGNIDMLLSFLKIPSICFGLLKKTLRS